MNITIILGIVIGFVTAAIGMTNGGSVGNFLDLGSFAIVAGGTIGAIIAAYPMADMKKIPTLIKIAIKKSDTDYSRQVAEIIEMANIAQKTDCWHWRISLPISMIRLSKTV